MLNKMKQGAKNFILSCSVVLVVVIYFLSFMRPYWMMPAVAESVYGGGSGSGSITQVVYDSYDNYDDIVEDSYIPVVEDSYIPVTDEVINVVDSVTEVVYGPVSPPGSFPHDISVGGYVIEAALLSGGNCNVSIIDDVYAIPKAEIIFDNATIKDIQLYKNLTLPEVGDCNITITSGSLSDIHVEDLKMEISEMYAQQVATPENFPVEFWTTKPEHELLYRLDGGGAPIFEVSTVKLNTHSVTARKITIPNFTLKVEPGHKTSYVE